MTLKKKEKIIKEKLEKLEEMANRNLKEVQLDLDLLQWFTMLDNNMKLSIYQSYQANKAESLPFELEEEEEFNIK